MKISGDPAKTFAIRCSCGALGGWAHDLSSDDGPRLICFGAALAIRHVSFLGLNHACIGRGDDHASLNVL